jgi:ribosomal protein S24E
MNVHVISSTENKLLDRKEISAEVSFDKATPKRAELKTAVCHKIGANPDISVLRKVESSFGRKTVKVVTYAYTSKEALMATEPIYIKVREGMMAKPEKKKEAPKPKVRKKE